MHIMISIRWQFVSKMPKAEQIVKNLKNVIFLLTILAIIALQIFYDGNITQSWSRTFISILNDRIITNNVL